MLIKNRLTMAVSAALGLAAFGGAPQPAHAQEPALLEEVIVTGSRIVRSPENYLGSMAIASGEDIEKIGSYSTLDLLNRLPSVTNSGGGTNRNNSNGGRGANFVEIHNLAAERTLVLMDGRRVVNTIRDSSGLAVDIQSFPPNMIERVEVLADGASAIYGSDAIAGVVNVITRKDFEGFEFTAGAGTPQDPGGDAGNVGFLFGAQGDRGHFVVGGTYTETENVDYLDRDWSRIPILGEASDGAGGKLILMGSGVPPEGTVPDASIIFKPDPTTGASYQPFDTFGFSGLNGSAGDGSLQSILDTGHRYNYNDPGGNGVSLINPAKVFNFGTIGEIQLSNQWTAYTSILAQHREGTLFFTPLPVTGAAGRFTDLLQIPFSNPNLPEDAKAVIREAVGPDTETFQMFYRGSDLGNREFEYDADTMQATFGFKGDLEFADRSWMVDTWGTWGQSRLTEVTSGQLNVANLQTAVDPLACSLVSSCPKDANGDPIFDPFGRSPKTQEEINFITFDDHEKTEYEMWHLAASIATGNLLPLPAGDVGFAAGVEWRDESGSVTPSGIVGNGDSGGNFAEPTSGGYNLFELFAEFDIPLISDSTLAYDVSSQAAVRYSEYDSYDETTWKIGGKWGFTPAFSLRAQASTGFRAPNVLELFGGNADSFIGVTDPCNAVNQASNPVVAANCASQGVPMDFVQPAAQLKITEGGNPDLEPETSDNFSIGLVFTPEVWSSPRITIDYYDVEVDGAISTPVPSNIINTCYESEGLSAPECGRIARGPAGDVVRFDLLLENLATIETAGVDVNMAFSWDTSLGYLEANWLVNYLDEYIETTDSGTSSALQGKVACDICSFSGFPRIKSNMNMTLTQNNWSGSLTWRYIDGMDVSDEIGFDEFTTTTDAVNYFDLFASYQWNNVQLSVGVENLTDEEPPFVPSISTNTSPIYDFLGRFYSARIKLSM